MKKLKELQNTPRLIINNINFDISALYGTVVWDDLKFVGSVICGFDEAGWEHVSVSSRNKRQIPSWEVMCRLKDMFWNKEEEVVQIHPRESEYVHGIGDLGNVLHLWRPVDGDWRLMNRKEES